MVNIAFIRVFINLRQMMDANKDLIRRIDSLEEKYDKKITLVFEAIKELIRGKKSGEQIGYKTGGSSTGSIAPG